MDAIYYRHCCADFRGLADAILVVEEQQLPVHKAILAANSATFAKMFKLCSGSTVPLGDSLRDVCTTLKVLYEGCSAIHASKLNSVEDAYCVTRFAHKYDMKDLLEQCEAYLVTRAHRSSWLFGRPGGTVRCTLLAEKCEMSTLLAECQLFMARNMDDFFWSDPAENAMQLSTNSLLRMLKIAAWRNRTGRITDMAQIIKWQQPSSSEDNEASLLRQKQALYQEFFGC